ncbi:MAG: VWA domain-containing protein [Deltaproteobacteria bacterium]|nr:VWA domain-containing protein [Deltaproteobacteria bacterium]
MWRTIVIGTLVLSACSSVKLFRAGTLEKVAGDPPVVAPIVSAPLRYEIGDVFCTTPSREVTIPFKLLVIVDFSGSNGTTDPGGVRMDAIQALADSYRDEENVHFGFLAFSDTTIETSLGKAFTNDRTLIDSVIGELRGRTNGGRTNYQASLEWAHDAIELDSAKKTHVGGTKYGILFLTDGRPNVPEADADEDTELLANRPKIRERLTGCNGYYGDEPPLAERISFLNTYFYHAQGEDALASQLLSDMAEGPGTEPCSESNWGHGEFHEVTNVADLDLRVKLPTLKKVFVNDRQMIFMNYNLRALYREGVMTMAVDSDGDGLADALESEVPDPKSAYDTGAYTWDTDGDGIGDLVEYVLGLESNLPVEDPAPRTPIRAASRAQGLFLDEGAIAVSEHDKDGDGLSNTEEDLLATDPLRIDTDMDGLSDLIEVRNFLNPLSPLDAALDVDGDGVDSKTEITQGMDPHHQETQSFRDANGYRVSYGKEFTLGSGAGVRTCYEFHIGNISYQPVNTKDGVTIDRNVFELSFIDRTRLPSGASDHVSRREVFFAESGRDRAVQYTLARTLQNPW